MLKGWVIWLTDTPYECGTGIDEQVYDSQQVAEELRAYRGWDTDKYCTLEYIECPAD